MPIVPKKKAGRPKGSKNKSTILAEIVKAQFDTCLIEKFPEVLERTLELADKGNPTALKILWDRLMPAKKVLQGQINEGLQSGVQITINAIPGPEGSGVTIEGEQINGREPQRPTGSPHTGDDVQRAISLENTSPEAPASNSGKAEIWKERG